MFHVKVRRKGMKMESETDTLLVKMFRYRKMQTLDLLLDCQNMRILVER